MTKILCQRETKRNHERDSWRSVPKTLCSQCTGLGLSNLVRKPRFHILQLKSHATLLEPSTDQISWLLFKNKSKSSRQSTECYPSREEVPRFAMAPSPEPPHPPPTPRTHFPEEWQASWVSIFLSCFRYLSWDLTGRKKRPPPNSCWWILGVSDSLDPWPAFH